MRLTIAIGRADRQQKRQPAELHSTGFVRWNTVARDSLFPTLAYVPLEPELLRNEIPKLGNLCEVEVLRKVFKQSKTLAAIENPTRPFKVYAHRIASYFVKCLTFIPHFSSERDGQKRSDDYKIFGFDDEETATLVCALLNSTLFYLYYIAYSDGYHCGRELIESFPFDPGSVHPGLRRGLVANCARLMNDLQQNCVRQRIAYRNTGWVELDKYYPKLSKPIIDELDECLASVYGLTPEELDTVTNYDIKYRLGAELDEPSEPED